MAEFAHNNAKNASTGYIPFKLNYGYHPRVSFKEDVDPRSKSCFSNKLAEEVKKLMEVCCQNLLHAQNLQKKKPMIKELRAVAILRARRSG